MAKTITKEEFEALKAVPSGKKHPVYLQMAAMKKGEFLQIEKQEFTWKGHTPSIFCNRLKKEKKGKWKLYKTAGGWVVEKVE